MACILLRKSSFCATVSLHLSRLSISLLSKRLLTSDSSLLQATVAVQLPRCVQLAVTPRTAACQSYLSFTISWSSLKFMSIKSVMPSNHLILHHPLLLLPSVFPRIRVFSNEIVLHITCQNMGVSASASVLQMNIQD